MAWDAAYLDLGTRPAVYEISKSGEVAEEVLLSPVAVSETSPILTPEAAAIAPGIGAELGRWRTPTSARSGSGGCGERSEPGMDPSITVTRR